MSDADRRAIAEEGCIIRGLVGSTIHGLMLEGQDDRDEMAVTIDPPEAVVQTALGEELQRLAPAFASRLAVVKFLGYMNNQRERLSGGSRGHRASASA